MDREIIIVQTAENEGVEYFAGLTRGTEHLCEVTLRFPSNFPYGKYEEDLTTLKRGWSQYAELIDTRGIPGYDLDPVRILLSDGFFDLDARKQDEIVFHEFGHYFTNPRLQEIRNYIAEKNPPTLGINVPNLKNLVNAHNTGLNFVFQIPKLVQELNAEMWVFENERRHSESRISEYCDSMESSIQQFSDAQINDAWFYEIPQINFLLLWRLTILTNVDFDFTTTCLGWVEKANTEFMALAEENGWGELEILMRQDAILRDLEYRKENVHDLCEQYEQILKNYIENSAQFFPQALRGQLFKLYRISS